jgi:secreted PhoX family phosphatase
VELNGRLFLAGEENGSEGRLFAIEDDGVAWQVPRAGLLSWENAPVANTGDDTTVLMGNPDATPGFLRLYKGAKTSTGSPVDRAGLSNGDVHVLVANAGPDDGVFRTANAKGKPVDVSFTKVDWNKTGAAQDADAKTAGALAFTRIEDGAWDPKNVNDYYFVTTENRDKTKTPQGALWRLRFKDVSKPELGGTLTVLLDGTEDIDPKTEGVQSWQKPDNLDIDTHGNMVIQEDPGAKNFITRDEESSGVIDAEALLGKGLFLLDAQVHATTDVSMDAVEKGQMLTMKVDWTKVFPN